VRYGSVCSGVEAATVAWEPFGWTPVFFAETAAFPSNVLSVRFPKIPNLGDFTRIGEKHGPIDLLVGGTPCQSFSVAGLREGLDDSRGNLALEFCRLALRLRPRWIVWENVPGVLSSNSGRDFGSILSALAELRYGWAYRILDAKYFGVPQSRRRLFVVGCLGNPTAAGAVLFEPQGMCRDSSEARDQREATPARVAPSIRSNVPKYALTLCSRNPQNNDPTVMQIIIEGDRVRRLTPLEYERLQGLPDGHTAILGAADTPRYTAVGNSMAVPVMRWIGRRIDFVDSVLREA
jgi:DNA (cytosine-5)-methyltransferase 1